MKGDYKNYTIGASSMERTQKKIVYYITYAIVAVIFLMHFGFCFGSINFSEPTQATWSVPTTLPSGMRYSGSTYYASTPQEFLYAINMGSTTTIELVDNIDFSGNAYPTITKSTSVTINGNGYTILGIDINSASRIGLIGETSASVTINNVNLEVDIDHTSSTVSRIGGFVGYARSTVTINNCTVSGDIDVTSNATHYVGGFVGYSSNTISINNSVNYADIITVDATQVGGLIGHADSKSTTLSVCANFGYIEGEEGYIGGLIGSSQGNKEISKCFNSGNITGTKGSVGGLVGYNRNGVTFSSCYNTGNINLSSSNSKRGGIVGYAEKTQTFNYCYSIGTISPNSISKSITVSTNKNVTPTYKCYTEDITMSQNDFNNGIISNLYNGGGGTPNNVDLYIKVTSVKFTSNVSVDLCGSQFTSFNSYCYYSEINNNIDFSINFQVSVGGTIYNLPVCQKSGTSFSFSLSNYNFNITEVFVDSEYDEFFSNFKYRNNDIRNTNRYAFRYAKIDSIQISYSGSNLTFTPKLQYRIWLKNNNDAYTNGQHGGALIPGVDTSTYEYTNTVTAMGFNAPSVNISRPTGTGSSNILDSVNEINNISLGSEYIKDSNINDGHPVLKDFYWLYA